MECVPNASATMSDLATQPYWWQDVENEPERRIPLPKAADVCIVGAGITGLSSALTLTRAGREVLVLDGADPGTGASTRNAGYVGTDHLESLSTLITRLGEQAAVGLAEEGVKAFDYTVGLIRREQIECSFNQCGRVRWAYTSRQREYLERQHAALEKHFDVLGIESKLIGPSATSGELASDQYREGLLMPSTATLHPARYLHGLLERIRSRGGTVAGHARVRAIDHEGAAVSIHTERGEIRARHVIIATNAYVGGEAPYFRRRVMPVWGQMIAVDAGSAELMDQLMPTNRSHLDVRAMFRYWRRSPDGTRVLFGSRTALPFRSVKRSARELQRLLVEIFPQLSKAGVTNCWAGRIGITVDRLPHLGWRDGILFATGMNGHGVPMGTYLGNKIALRLLGSEDSETAFDRLSFRAMPLVRGMPWFLPFMTGALRVAGWLERRAD
jgi:glycine/D-amino acid oxidase-like deaminating enzyme